MKVRLIFVLTFTSWQLLAQSNPRPPIDLESFVERLFPVQEEDLDYESIYEQLFQLYQNPIQLNYADAEILQASYLLSPTQISHFLEYREDHGKLISIYELQAIPEFDLETIDRLLPFVTLGEIEVRTKPFLQRITESENAYLLFRHRRTWEKRRGFSLPDTSNSGTISSRYLGDPNELYLRFRIQKYRDFSLGFTLEKDAGEQFTWDASSNRYGFNFQSFHVFRQNMGSWKSLAIGDFQASFGQGLVFGAGYTLGKGAETVPTVRRSSVGLIPYTAALEFGFYRGIAATRVLGNWQMTMIASTNARDGRIRSAEDEDIESGQEISSISESGLHRTPSEISTKSQLREANLGANLQFTHPSNKWNLGGNTLWTRFNLPWVKPKAVYNQFDFSGQTNQVSSFYFNYNWKNFFLFGETALSKSKGTGTVLGFVSSLSKQVDFSFLWRRYDRDFHSFYSSGFAENTRPTNEHGVYVGIQYTHSKAWKFNFYYDFFSFPWLKYRVYAPSKGQEWLGRLTFQPRRNLNAFFQVRQEVKDRNISDSNNPQESYQVKPIQKTNATLSLETNLSKSIFIRSRILWSQVSIESQKTYGILVYQDLSWAKSSWKLTGRFAVFDTETYDNRLYAFENNVLWTFSVPAYSGRGVRYYLLTQYDLGKKLTAYFRISRTIYTDRESISSGLQTIEAPHQTDTALMLRYFLR